MKTMAKKIDITKEDYAMLMPTGDRVLIKRDKGEEKTESGIIYVKEQRRQTGVILAVGDDEKFTNGKSRITPGCKVYFLEEGYVPIGDFLLMQTSSVLGVFHESAVESTK
jgi:co-chaperonin GroES (HSP10)